MLPIALQLYSIRDDMQDDFEGSLRKVKLMGYEGVEFAGLCDRTATEVKSLLADIGLIPVSAHVPYAEMIDAPDDVLGRYKEIGCPYVAVPYLTEEYRIGAEKGQEALAGIRMLAETAHKLGMTMLYHNHDFEFQKIGGEYALDVLYNTIPAELLQTELDTCWVAAAGVDAPAYLRKYAGRAPVVHLKDFVMGDSGPEGAYELIGIESDNKEKAVGFEFRPLGHGQQNIPSILAAANDAGAKWLVVEQDQSSMGKTPMECAEMSIQYLKSL
ncbi:MAG: sugar phosphate isomerase/epimerase [Oscillospiraceae bacterium]|nr:sugar phosphate isomerase/epimerase [Oscillospiraceae bacterium]